MAQHMVYGFHAVSVLLNIYSDLVNEIYVTDKVAQHNAATLLALAHSLHIKVHKKSRKVLDQMCQDGVHQGVIAICSNLPQYNDHDLTKIMSLHEPALVLILDEVQDPHNLGACLRTANAMGVNAVVAPKDRAASLTAGAIKASAGAAFATPFVQVTNLSRTLRELKQQGIWVVGAESKAELTMAQIDLQGSVAVVMGNESSGMRRLTREHCDYLVAIPMVGAVESLNVSVATGIMLYEVQRQRHRVAHFEVGN